MTIQEVNQYMIDLGYVTEISTDTEYYEGKNIIHTIIHADWHKQTDKKSIAWYHLENRSGDIYFDDWTWYLNGKAYNSDGEYDYFEKEVEKLNRDILEEFINQVENYRKS